MSPPSLAFAFLNGIIHENEKASCLVRDYKWKSTLKIDGRRMHAMGTARERELEVFADLPETFRVSDVEVR